MIGVILAGGKSTRMGTDKAHLPFYNRPIYLHLKDILLPYCKSVFISSNLNNDSSFILENTIVDETQFNNSGPIGGILSAMSKVNGPWLIVSCDVPGIESKDIDFLINGRSAHKVATVFKNCKSDMIEPLIGIYEMKSKAMLLDWFEKGNTSVRIFLEHNNAELVPFSNFKKLQSINTPEMYAKFKNLL